MSEVIKTPKNPLIQARALSILQSSLKALLKNYGKLSKAGIVCFVLLTASAGYLLSLSNFASFSLWNFSVFLLGLYFCSSASFILNQAQEWRLDQKMKRTKGRPIPSGKVLSSTAYTLALLLFCAGFMLLSHIQLLSAVFTLLTAVLYNGFYTLFWKRRLKYGAVWGALPGALPPVIGWVAEGGELSSPVCAYLFLLLFFWQMPHFWSLALRYTEDYRQAGVPTLSVVDGERKTLYQMGFYLLAYIGAALISPLFLPAGPMYLLLGLPLGAVLFYQFHQYFYNHSSRWLNFFLWLNASILVYFFVPVLDHWIVSYMFSLHLSKAGF